MRVVERGGRYQIHAQRSPVDVSRRETFFTCLMSIGNANMLPVRLFLSIYETRIYLRITLKRLVLCPFYNFLFSVTSLVSRAKMIPFRPKIL